MQVERANFSAQLATVTAECAAAVTAKDALEQSLTAVGDSLTLLVRGHAVVNTDGVVPSAVPPTHALLLVAVAQLVQDQKLCHAAASLESEEARAIMCRLEADLAAATAAQTQSASGRMSWVPCHCRPVWSFFQ